jgi:hypothetical protein
MKPDPITFCMKTILFYTVVISCLTGCDHGTSSVNLEKTIGFKGNESAQSIRQTPDGGFIITGHTDSFRSNYDLYLVKTDDRFDMEWSKIFGTDFFDQGYDVQLTSDGGFIIVGAISLDRFTSRKIYVIKTDADGKLLWSRTLGNSYSEGHSIAELKSGGYIIAGTDSTTQNTNIYLAKLNETGTVMWTKIYDSGNLDYVNAIYPTNDGGFVLVGYQAWVFDQFISNALTSDIMLVKYSSSGVIQYSKKLDNPTPAGSRYTRDAGYSVKQTADGGLIIAGNSRIIPLGYHSRIFSWIIKTDGNGNTQWSKLFDDSVNSDFKQDYRMPDNGATSIDQTADNGFVFTGFIYTDSLGTDRQLLLVRLGTNGDVMWSKRFGGRGDEQGLAIQTLREGGFVVAGYTQSFGGGGSDMYLIHTDNEGNIVSNVP